MLSATPDRVPSAGELEDHAPAVELVRVEKLRPQHGWPAKSAVLPLKVIADVNLSVGRGEVIALLGMNGAGKTTLLKIIAGLARADAGSVRIFGDAITDGAARRGRRVAYAGGERGFYFRLTTRENLAFFAALDELGPLERAERIVEVAHTVDIEADLDRRFADLSSGTRQRLSIARALISDPDVLLLDEPTRALDPPHAAQLRGFVRDGLARRRGKTVILATNLIDEALDVGDRIAILRASGMHFVPPGTRSDTERVLRAFFGLTDGA